MEKSIKWMRAGQEILDNGESTVFYRSKDGRFSIESRKRAIPHANGKPGCWYHTTYWLTDGNDGTEKEYFALKDAKEAAEGKA